VTTHIYDPNLKAMRVATASEAAADRKARFGLSRQQLAVLAAGPSLPMVCPRTRVLHKGSRTITVGNLNMGGALVFVECPNGAKQWLLREQYPLLKAANQRFRAASKKKKNRS